MAFTDCFLPLFAVHLAAYGRSFGELGLCPLGQESLSDNFHMFPERHPPGKELGFKRETIATINPCVN